MTRKIQTPCNRKTCRAARRNAWRKSQGRFPWPGIMPTMTKYNPPVRPNERDRSKDFNLVF